MAQGGSTDTSERLASLEREVERLRVRVAALERLMGAGSEHPEDDSTVRRKVTYDWQA